MRSPYRTTEAALATAPEAVSQYVLAMNRMGFGPRSGDWTRYDALGTDHASRFAAYVEQQLYPAAIDDSECDEKIARKFPSPNWITFTG